MTETNPPSDTGQTPGTPDEPGRTSGQHRGPWWLAPVAVLLVAGALADLLGRDWRLFVGALVVLAVSTAIALRARRRQQ